MLSATHGASHEGRGVTPMHGSKVIIFFSTHLIAKKLIAFILEAHRVYFGSSSRLFWKLIRPVSMVDEKKSAQKQFSAEKM